MTKCEELQFDLPLYFDGSLNPDERSAIEVHLPECPLCRQKLSEFQDLSAGFKSFARPAAPDGLVDVIRAAVASRLSPVSSSPVFHLIERQRSWSEIWLMPFSISAVATVVLGFTLLSLVLTSDPISLTAYTESSDRSSAPAFL